MNKATHTSPQTYLDPWLLTARSASMLGFTYSGAKNRLAKDIVPHMPQRGRIYCEPFAGLGALYWKMALAADYKQWRLNDIRTAPFFRALLTRGNALEVPARSHEEFLRQKAAFALGDPAAILLGPYFSFNGGFYRQGERADKGSITATSYEARLRMSNAIMTLTQPQVMDFDWKVAVADLGADDFVYIDPPYRDCRVGSYKSHDLCHEELVEKLLNAPYRWLLSEYEHPVYARLGRPCWRKEVQLGTTNYRDDGGKGRRTECLWKNY